MKVTIHTDTATLPALPEGSYFHSRELMELCLRTPRHKPYMAVVTDDDGEVVAHLLAVERYRYVWMPPLFHRHVRILGEGIYRDKPDNMLFSMMIDALTKRLSGRSMYMEVSHLSQKMFGYKQLRQQGFFPVNWSSVHNSLHSHAPEERISAKMQKRIDTSHNKGVKTEIVTTEEDFKAFSKLLREHNFLKPKRYIPDNIFFRKLMEGQHGQLFVTKYHNKVIACAACVYSMGNAYLWYTAFRRKTYRHLHPDIIIVWDVMKDAYQKGYAHMCFMDVGLPFSKNPFREFILRFGGKEQSTYRWFRFSIRWVNALLSWLYRE